jgi:hypothetical protein
MFVTLEEHEINNFVEKRDQVSLTGILLENQADKSILNPSLLSDIRYSKKTIIVKGFGGLQMVFKEKEILKDFFEVYA